MNNWLKNLLLLSLILLSTGWGSKAWAISDSYDNIGNPTTTLAEAKNEKPTAEGYSPKAWALANQLESVDNQIKTNPPPANLAELSSLKENLLLEYSCYKSGVCHDGAPWIPMSIYGTDADAYNFARLQAIQRHWSGNSGINQSNTKAYEEARQAMSRRMADLQTELAKDPERKALGDEASKQFYNQDIRKDIEQRRNCGLWNWGPCFVDAVNYLTQTIIKPVGEKLVKGANYLFNASFQFSVRDFSTYASKQSIKDGWTIVRDLTNIGFIFALLYAATSIILQLKSVDGKRMIGMIVVGALLVNFSAFFVGIVINASNVLANQIYLAAAGDELLDGTPDLAGKIIKYRNTVGNGSQTTLAPDQTSTDALSASIMNGLGSATLAIVTAVVLLAGALMMLTRFLKLLLVIVFSPILFLGLGLPLARSWGGEWVKKTLFSEAFFAPAYLLMLLVASKFIAVAEFNLPGKPSSFVNAVFYNFITVGLMVGSLLIAQFVGHSSGGYVANKLKQYGRSLGLGLAGASTFGAAGRLGRSIIGRAAKNELEDPRTLNRSNQRGVSGWLAKQTLKVADFASKSSFDARGLDSVKKLGLGEGQKGGYVGDIKRKAEAAGKIAKLIGAKDSEGSEVSAREQARIDDKKLEARTRADEIQAQAKSAQDAATTSAQAEINAKKAEQAREIDRIGQEANAQLQSNGAKPEEVKAERERKEEEVRQRIEAQIKEVERKRDESISKASSQIKEAEKLRTAAEKLQPRKRVQELADQYDDAGGKEPQSWYRFNRWRGKVTRTRKAQAAAIRESAKSKKEKYQENLAKLLEKAEKEEGETNAEKTPNEPPKPTA